MRKASVMSVPVLFFCIIFFVSNSFGSSDCVQLKQELKSMQEAQRQIMLSLVNNHETFASSLEEYSSAVVLAEKAAVRVTSSRMNDSAKAFRARGVLGKKMALKLNKSTGDLIVRVASCLK